MEEYKAEAIRNALHLNPDVKEDRQGVLCHKGRPIGGHQKLQVQLAYTCGKHYKQSNVCSITRPADLLCPCDTSDEVLKVEKKQRLGPSERILASVLEHACMLGAFRFQAKVLKHWKGGVDFYCPSTRLVIQVDDPHHFRIHHIHGKCRGEILEQDMTVNMLCWQQGFPLLRMAKPDVKDHGLAKAMVELVQKYVHEHAPLDGHMKLLVLSKFYRSVKMGEMDCYGDGQDMYLATCRDKLQVEGRVPVGCYDSVWFAM